MRGGPAKRPQSELGRSAAPSRGSPPSRAVLPRKALPAGAGGHGAPSCGAASLHRGWKRHPGPRGGSGSGGAGRTSGRGKKWGQIPPPSWSPQHFGSREADRVGPGSHKGLFLLFPFDEAFAERGLREKVIKFGLKSPGL